MINIARVIAFPLDGFIQSFFPQMTAFIKDCTGNCQENADKGGLSHDGCPKAPCGEYRGRVLIY
jgi:hypothetical protein